MNYIKGFNRNQAILIPETIDLLIHKNNEIRFIDIFVDSLDVVDFGAEKFQDSIRSHLAIEN